MTPRRSKKNQLVPGGIKDIAMQSKEFRKGPRGGLRGSKVMRGFKGVKKVQRVQGFSWGSNMCPSQPKRVYDALLGYI